MDAAAFALQNPYLLLVPACLAVWGIHRHLEKRRVERLRAAAVALGLSPSDDDLDRLPGELRELSLFTAGHSRRAENVFWSERREYVIFEYRYTVGSGKNQATWTQSVGAFHLPGRGLPVFTAAPEQFSDKLASWFGGQDIDFGEDPEFSKGYRLRGTDEERIRGFFGAAPRRFLASRGGWTVQAKGDWLIAFKSGLRAKPEGLRDFQWDLQGLYAALLGA
ncbi:MAG: hypothetical protein HY928_17470 [Elusimicrobia bacterium]|nr:hypothetical protein [Elusimicrobiota bacterium]